jgi:molybdate transport system substrate-binding protein
VVNNNRLVQNIRKSPNLHKKIIALFLSGFLFSACSDPAAENLLVCQVGGTMTPVMKVLANIFEKKTGTKIEISTAGSGELLATIEMQNYGDLYVSHDPFMDLAMQKGLGVNAWSIAEIYPVIIVQKGNPKNIKSLQDFTRDDVEVVLTDYKHSTLGYLLPTIFKKAGIDFDELNKKKKITTHRSGSYVANLIKMKNADAAIVWQAVAHLRKNGVDAIPISKYLPTPGVDTITSATGKEYFLTPVKVTITSLVNCEKQDKASEFAEFIMSEEGQAMLKKYGFATSDNVRKLEYANGIKLE